MLEKSENNLNLLDFGIVGEQLTISELLHSSYVRGREDFQKEVEVDFKKNIQSAAHSSSLLKSKLSEIGVDVKGMFLKVINFNTFKCLVIVDEEDFYSRNKRWNSYKISEDINSTNSRIDLTFSFMSNSEELMVDNVISDGFIFKYGTEKI
ncbi:hypothetical protein SAMN04487911_13028 [Arenibacter nanhaiticus]|uniref:Uncharacterized protein n=1 Tax=Arenibacter nanhaiticus TaxID=558155 RepID=A0A1M6L9I3_9FLAO|nr:hypothetical protein [Arenibacter nanhaiticus]SHJ67813.1 hypothetical protein SAMN04487911_13028 [Arenibacter nanhaiticus]